MLSEWKVLLVVGLLDGKFAYLPICEEARWWAYGYTLMSEMTNSVVDAVSKATQ